jgi:hypothetical protein
MSQQQVGLIASMRLLPSLRPQCVTPQIYDRAFKWGSKQSPHILSSLGVVEQFMQLRLICQVCGRREDRLELDRWQVRTRTYARRNFHVSDDRTSALQPFRVKADDRVRGNLRRHLVCLAAAHFRKLAGKARNAVRTTCPQLRCALFAV